MSVDENEDENEERATVDQDEDRFAFIFSFFKSCFCSIEVNALKNSSALFGILLSFGTW